MIKSRAHSANHPLVLVGAVTLLAWLGAAATVCAADWDYPLAVGVAKDGSIYVADRYLPGVWKLNGAKPEIFFKGDKKFRTPLNAPRCIGFDKDGKLLVGDSATRDVYRFDESGKPQPLTGGEIGIPMGIAVMSSGEILVSDLEAHRIWKISAAGGKPEKFADVSAPHGMTVDTKGRAWVVSHGADQLLRLGSDGKAEIIVKGRPFSFPHEVVLDKEGRAFVSDGYAKAVWKVETNGSPAKWVEGNPLVSPVGLAWKSAGGPLLIIDPHAKQLFQAEGPGKIAAFRGASEK